MAETTKPPPPYGSQQFIDWVNLLYHRRIAELLQAEPERVLGKARANLLRWLAAYEAGDSAADCLSEWLALLDVKNPAELGNIIAEDSDEGQRLRSSTPFVGLLSQQEMQAFEAHYEQAAVA